MKELDNLRVSTEVVLKAVICAVFCIVVGFMVTSFVDVHMTEMKEEVIEDSDGDSSLSDYEGNEKTNMVRVATQVGMFFLVMNYSWLTLLFVYSMMSFYKDFDKKIRL